MPPGIAVAGSGAAYLLSDRFSARRLISLIRAHDIGRVSPKAIGAYLAAINQRIHLAEESVGYRCIVSYWLQQGGGGHLFYGHGTIDSSPQPTEIPTIASGMNIHDLIRAALPHVIPGMLERWRTGEEGQPAEPDSAAINADLARMPWHSDETLT
jgi:hypothetical protein